MGYKATELGVADLNAKAARQMMEDSQESATPLHLHNSGVLRMVHNARTMAPLKADYALLEGDIQHLVYQNSIDPDERKPTFTQMLRSYRETVALRPTWSLAWMNLAKTHYQYYGVDQWTRVAMHRALTLGPWEPEVMGQTSWLAMNAWQELSTEEQEMAWEVIKRAARDPHLQRLISGWASDAGWSGFLRRVLRENQRGL